MAALMIVAACGSGGPSTDSAAPRPSIGCAITGAAPAGSDVAVYFAVESRMADSIVSVSSDEAAGATLHWLEPLDGGGAVMRNVDSIEVLPGSTRLGLDTNHVMLERTAREFIAGTTVNAEVEFADQGSVPLTAEVLDNSGLLDALRSPCP